MADDIFGHDHLDHDRHLHNHQKKWAPGERYSRGQKPVHVASSVRKNIRMSGADAYAHLHRRTGPLSQSDEEVREQAESRTRSRYFPLVAFLVSAALLLIVWNVLPAIGFIVGALAVNTLIELHKRFTQGVPLDLEVLFSATAAATAVYGILAGLVLVFVGPLLAASVRGHVCSSVVRKSGALLVTALAASVLAASRFELLFAVVLGIIALYALITITGRNAGASTILGRVTTLGLNAIIITTLLPALLGIS